MSFIKSKKQLAITVLFLLILLFGIVISFSAIDTLILKYVEFFSHKTLRNPARWIDIIQNTSALVIFALSVTYFFCYIPYGVTIKARITEILGQYKIEYATKRTGILFLGTVFFLFFAYFNVITANFFYSDDLFRNYGGNRSWIGFSRYISEFGSIFIHNSLKLTDIAPLTQLIAILIAALTVLIVSISLTDSIKIKNLFALTLIFIAPFYAENMSYRFDAPYMSMSLFFTSVPFLFKRDRVSFCCVSVISLLLTCISYQAALPLYVLAVIYLFVKSFLCKKDFSDSWKFVLCSVASFVAAMLIFKLFFMNKMTNNADDYFSTKINIFSFFTNCVTYIKLTFTQNGGLLTKVLFLISIVLLVFSVSLCTRQNKFLSLILVSASIVISYALSFGPYLVFERPVFALRAFMGFNVLIAFIVLALFEMQTRHNSLENVKNSVASIFIYSCIVFLFAYGNVLKN
mgnify:CR=1 FL=1